MPSLKLSIIIVIALIINHIYYVNSKVDYMKKNKIRNLDGTISNKITLYFNNISGNIFLFVCSILVADCSSTNNYNVNLLKNDGTKDKDITNLLIIKNITSEYKKLMELITILGRQYRHQKY